MKKLFIFASVVGLAAGVIYLLRKNEKSNNTVYKPAANSVDFEYDHQEKDSFRETDAINKIYQTKNESAQVVCERHLEASEIMKDAYNNIMEDFVEDFSSEKVVSEKENIKEVVIDNETVSIMKELDSISDEIDNLLN